MGYSHGPRAIRDVRELGFGIVTARGTDGFAIYAFDTPLQNDNQLAKSKGRTALEKELRSALVAKYEAKDFITLEPMDEKLLQVDHRVPYEIGGEPDHADLTKFMLLSGSSNRLKSHACERCPNWSKRSVAVCESCFWAYPERYTHVAERHERSLVLIFSDDDAIVLEQARERYGRALAEKAKKSIIEAFTVTQNEKTSPHDVEM